MNETRKNNIEKVCESLTRDEAIEFCKKLIAENEDLISENDELKAINFTFALANGISKVVIERNESANLGR